MPLTFGTNPIPNFATLPNNHHPLRTFSHPLPALALINHRPTPAYAKAAAGRQTHDVLSNYVIYHEN